MSDSFDIKSKVLAKHLKLGLNLVNDIISSSRHINDASCFSIIFTIHVSKENIIDEMQLLSLSK